LRKPVGLLRKYSLEGDYISAPRVVHCKLRDSLGLGVKDNSDLGDSPGLPVGGCSVHGHLLRREDYSEPGDRRARREGIVLHLGIGQGSRYIVGWHRKIGPRRILHNRASVW